MGCVWTDIMTHRWAECVFVGHKSIQRQVDTNDAGGGKGQS